jgi:hypothetical protein
MLTFTSVSGHQNSDAIVIVKEKQPMVQFTITAAVIRFILHLFYMFVKRVIACVNHALDLRLLNLSPSSTITPLPSYARCPLIHSTLDMIL